MRQQDRVIMWPSYFDSTRTRKDGRQVAKSLAIPNPNIQEIREAADRLHVVYELVTDISYPKAPWTKTGMLLVEKNKESKNQIIHKIARHLVKTRSSAA